MLYNILFGIIRPLAYIVFLLKTSYEAKLPVSGPVIYCQKHIAIVDPVFLAITQKRKLGFMAKAELFKFPPLAYLFRKMNAFPINRGKGDVSALKLAIKILKDGGALSIMPEGHRIRRNHDLEMKTGAVNLAYHAQATVIPVGIYTKNYTMRPFRKVSIRYGKPVTLEQIGLKDGSKEELLRILNEYIKPEIMRLSEKDYVKQ